MIPVIIIVIGIVILTVSVMIICGKVIAKMAETCEGDCANDCQHGA